MKPNALNTLLDIKIFLQNLPELPGVYKYLDADGIIIYVGKAKNLKKRVSSYFNKQHDNNKTRVLVSKINDIEYIVVDSEYDALLLENSLIKTYQPKYNINLKDDKSYPLIRITKERFPKVYAMRNPIKDGSEYYGPFSNVKLMHLVLDTAKKLYPTRNCNYDLSEKNIAQKKFKVCLEYQIGNCRGACEGKESEEEYNQSIDNIRHILKGNLKEVKENILAKIAEASEKLLFEDAHFLKEKLDLLEKFQSKSTVVNNKINNVDVFGIASNEQNAYVNYLRIANGMIIQSLNMEYRKRYDESDAEILSQTIAEIQNQYVTKPEEIILPITLEIEIPIKTTVPQAGDKKKLLDLSMKNARYYQLEKLKIAETLNPDLKKDRILQTMQRDLQLKQLPYHIECFDNSNIQGSFAVSSCVVFKDAKPSKKEYRHFNVKTVVGPNDFATMHEVITRRYSRLLDENLPLPQLIVVDGGKGQLSSAVEALKQLNIYSKIPIIGIAKRLEEIFYPNDPVPLYIDKKSETLKVIQKMRDEAHRFGITHHRNRRSKKLTSTELEAIPGIGKQLAEKLLSHFKSVAKIKAANLQELSAIVGQKNANKIQSFWQDETNA